MILFFDTETTGKLNYKAGPMSELQPDLVQLAACLTDDQGERVFGQMNMIVEPAQFNIPEEASKIHGIDHSLALQVGIPRRTVLSAFNHMCKHANQLVAHNMEFDYSIMLLAYYREEVPHRLEHLSFACTMKMATPILKLPKPAGKWKPRPGDEFKWPTLTECHQHFFGEPFEGAHNAMNDVLAMIRVWKAMAK